VWYLDSSTFLNLEVDEAESRAMRAWIATHHPIGSSQLLVTEVLRTSGPLGVRREAILDILQSVTLITPTAGTFLSAGGLEPTGLRSLDALHLAVAFRTCRADVYGLMTRNDDVPLSNSLFACVPATSAAAAAAPAAQYCTVTCQRPSRGTCLPLSRNRPVP